LLEKYYNNCDAGYEQIKGAKLMFADQAGFGRISEPANCWAPPKERPSVPSQRIRQYKTVYGAVCPETGEAFYLVMDGNNKENMSIFLQSLAEKFPDYIILLVVDNASWHMTQQENSKRRSKNKKEKTVFKTKEKLIVPSNIRLTYLPPRTPEMNPIEIIWREIRKRGFKNIAFDSLKAVIEKFYQVVSEMSALDVISLTRWNWIDEILNQVF
jgi:transposase